MNCSGHNSSIYAEFCLCCQFHPWECIIHLLYFVVDVYLTFCLIHIVKFQLVNNIYFFLLNDFFACLIISFSYLTFSLYTPPCSFPSSSPTIFSLIHPYVVFGVRGEAGFVDFCDEKSKRCKFLQPPQEYVIGGRGVQTSVGWFSNFKGTSDSGFEIFMWTTKPLGKVMIKFWNLWEPLGKVVVGISKHDGSLEWRFSFCDPEYN